MTDDERKVLMRLAATGGDYCYSLAAFDPIPRERARAACRSLAAAGLARFERGLFTDDGVTAGSGYGATRAGLDMARAIEVIEWNPFCECRQYPSQPIWNDPRIMLHACHGAEP